MLGENNKNRYKAFMLGMLTGAIIFILIYGVDILSFTNDSLIVNGYIEKDIAQHYTGWMLYRNSPWQFPLGAGQNLAYPYGSSVSYTDSIPLFAVFFKLFRNILPATFQYFGLFVLLCFMFQGGYAALLANLFTDSMLAATLTSAVFSLSPIMVERAFRHCGLTAHFLILAALYYYFKNKGKTDIGAVMPFIVINALAITIHPYFMPFTFGIMFAFCIEMFFHSKKYITSIGYIILSVTITLFTGYIIGTFYVGGSMSSIGYGMFSMNLNALFNPVSKGFENWSAFFTVRPNVSYQIEGFNYLGRGILAFIPVSLLICLLRYKKEVFNALAYFIRNYFGIVFSTAALLIFAVGDWVTYGGLQIFRLPIPHSLINGLFGIFRANGRFGWLLVYMITGFVIFTVITISKKNISSLLLAVLVAIQIFDIRGALTAKHNYFTQSGGDIQKQEMHNIISSSFWNMAAEKFDVVYRTYEPLNNSCIEIAQTFAKEGKKVNTAFEARVNHTAFAQLSASLTEGVQSARLEKGAIVLFAEYDDKFIETAKNNGYMVCLADNILAVCENRFTADELAVLSTEETFRLL